jgi:D-aminopeptidase
MRARELGIVVGSGRPGPQNAITDVPGVRVGHTTLISGEGPLRIGSGPVRSGVTVIVPHDGSVWKEPVFAGCHRLNGNGEMTGLEWVRESGTLSSPIGLTNTHSVGVVRDELIAAEVRERTPDELFWGLPVVAETWDGMLNDVNGQHVRPQHVRAALDSAASGPVPEGNVGGGTGMICHEFKGGTGTASRVVRTAGETYTVGALVQANYGARDLLRIDGVPIGRELGPAVVPTPRDAGSIIVVLATDAPLLPIQCQRLARRATTGLAWVGGVGFNGSGDIFLAFATGNHVRAGEAISPLRMLSPDNMDPLLRAAAEATEEAILNALCASETMTGVHGHTAHAMPLDALVNVMQRYRPRPA